MYGKVQKTVSFFPTLNVSKPSGFHAGTNLQLYLICNTITHPIITAKHRLSPAHGCCDLIFRHHANRWCKWFPDTEVCVGSLFLFLGNDCLINCYCGANRFVGRRKRLLYDLRTGNICVELFQVSTKTNATHMAHVFDIIL